MEMAAVKQGPRRATSGISRRLPNKRRAPMRRSSRALPWLLQKRRRTVAVVVSLLVHLVAIVFFVHHRAEPPNETVATVRRLTLDRKAAPTPRPVPRPSARPVLHSRPIAVPPPLPLPVPLPVPRTRTPPLAIPTVAPLVHVPLVRTAHRELAKPLTPLTPSRPTLSDARIAQITSDLRAQIASDIAHRPSALAVAPAALAAPRHYALDASNFTQGDRRSHGLCDPVKDWTQDDYDYYYVACNVKFSDGTFQRQSVPWPVRFPRSDDPFAGTANGEKPLAMPLPGWHLGPGDTVTPELRAYARERGVTLDGG